MLCGEMEFSKSRSSKGRKSSEMKYVSNHMDYADEESVGGINDDLMLFQDDDDEDENRSNLYGPKKKADFSIGAPPGSFEMYSLNQKALQDRKARNQEVIRQILADFNLEEVKEKYRGLGMVRDFSHANRKFRLWLENVMGNDKIQLSDRKWHDLFRQKVMEDYEHQIKERERQLAEAEVQRLQKLRLQGILTNDVPRETSHKNNSRRSKKKSPRSHDGRSSKHQSLYNRPQDDIETQIEVINKDSKQRERHKRREEDDSTENDDGDEKRTLSGNETGDNSSRKSEETDGSRSEDRASVSASPGARSYKAYLGISGAIRGDSNPSLQKLYNEEDLRQLYAQAEMLIRPYPKPSK